MYSVYLYGHVPDRNPHQCAKEEIFADRRHIKVCDTRHDSLPFIRSTSTLLPPDCITGICLPLQTKYCPGHRKTLVKVNSLEATGSFTVFM